MFQKHIMNVNLVPRLPMGIFSGLLAGTMVSAYFTMKPKRAPLNYFFHRVNQKTANYRLMWQKHSNRNKVAPVNLELQEIQSGPTGGNRWAGPVTVRDDRNGNL